jgi:hypothetical protein
MSRRGAEFAERGENEAQPQKGAEGAKIEVKVTILPGSFLLLRLLCLFVADVYSSANSAPLRDILGRFNSLHPDATLIVFRW